MIKSIAVCRSVGATDLRFNLALLVAVFLCRQLISTADRAGIRIETRIQEGLCGDRELALLS
ncbi:MAG: hypothetical protein AAF699_20325 [Pseudomonadota bacterium]